MNARMSSLLLWGWSSGKEDYIGEQSPSGMQHKSIAQCLGCNSSDLFGGHLSM